TSLIPVVSTGTSAVAGSGRAPRNAAVPPSAVARRNSRRFMPSAPSSARSGEARAAPGLRDRGELLDLRGGRQGLLPLDAEEGRPVLLGGARGGPRSTHRVTRRRGRRD